MKKNTDTSPCIVDLAKAVSADTLAKLYYLCNRRKLPFPEGVIVLLEEVSEPAPKHRLRKTAGNRKTRRTSIARTEEVS